MDLDEFGVWTRQYLDDSTSARWEEAARYVAQPARLVFPGSEFGSLQEMRDGLVRRYTDLVKHMETTDLATRADGAVIVTVSGTLAGTNLHGEPFGGVRFLDRLVWRDGLIVEQHVYNDLAASGVLDPRT